MAAGSAAPPPLLLRLLHIFEDSRVRPGFLGEVPGFDVFLFQDGGALAAVQLDAFEVARVGGGRGLDHTQGTACEAERGSRDVLDFDAFVGERGGLGLDFRDRAHQPAQQVDGMDRLIHQRATAVEFPGAAPRAAIVILLRAIPLDVRVAQC